MNKALLLTTLILSVTILVAADDPNAILGKVDAILNPAAYESYRRIINEEPSGRKKEFSFFTLKKGRDKVAMLYLAPATDAGRTALRLGDNFWMYIPTVGKPIRLNGMQSITGGIFNNADIMSLNFSYEYDPSIESTSSAEYVLALKAKTKAVAYDKLIMRVDKKTFFPVKIDCYGASGSLIKTLQYSEAKDFGNGIVQPSILETTSPLYQGYRSTMIFQRITPRQIADEVYTINYMSRIKEQRR